MSEDSEVSGILRGRSGRGKPPENAIKPDADGWFRHYEEAGPMEIHDNRDRSIYLPCIGRIERVEYGFYGREVT